MNEAQLSLGRHPRDGRDAQDISSPTLDLGEMHEYVNAQEERYWQAMERAFANQDEARFTEDEDRRMHYEAKPVYVWLPGGFAAVFLFWFQHYIFLHHADWGAPFGGLDGYVRLGLLLLGGYCVFIAWPWRRLNGQTASDREAAKQLRADFHRRLRDRMRRR